MKFDQMNKISETKTSREDGKTIYVKFQYKGTCTTCGKYGHKGKDSSHKEGENVQKCHYCDKPGHLKKDFRKRIRELKITTGTKITIKM